MAESTQIDNQLKKKIKFKPPHEFIEAKLTSGSDSRDVQSLVSLYRASGCRLIRETLKASINEKNQICDQNDVVEQSLLQRPDCLDPASHQRLSVLFCSFLSSTTT